MLKSFRLNDNISISDSIQDQTLSLEEWRISEKTVKKIRNKEIRDHPCPGCHSSKSLVFFEKWGVKYLICQDCGSIYAICAQNEINDFNKSTELLSLRESSNYQKDAFNRRIATWKDFLEWLQFRIFRFTGKKAGLSVLDYGNRYVGFIELISHHDMFASYSLYDSIIKTQYSISSTGEKRYDAILYFNKIQQSLNPLHDFLALKDRLTSDGLLFFQSRVSSGFDILTLRGLNDKIFPFEQIFIPSKEILCSLLKEAGFEILEITTPGELDVNYVYQRRKELNSDNLFTRYMFNTASPETLVEFQRFLQKNSMSSFIQIIARKR
ncbi:MAG: hypothetical protein WCT17_00380 [Bacilli bacterium]